MTHTASNRDGGAAHAARRESVYHEARILLLVNAFSSSGQPLTGLTKLAKLDFLLRYPLMTQRILPQGITFPTAIAPTWDELHAVESRMIRYKYGPWDDRYYPILGALVGKQLAVFAAPGGPFAIELTAAGLSAASDLAQDTAWGIIAERARFLQAHFDIPGHVLKDMIYAKLPDVAAIPMRSEI